MYWMAVSPPCAAIKPLRRWAFPAWLHAAIIPNAKKLAMPVLLVCFGSTDLIFQCDHICKELRASVGNLGNILFVW